MIKNLLKNRECDVKKCGESILLFDSRAVYPEDYIVIEKENTSLIYTVAEVHKEEKIIKVMTLKEKEAAIYGFVLYKRLFENIVDNQSINTLYKYIYVDDFDGALNYCTRVFDDSVYSIGNENADKISFIKKSNTADVKFDGVYIVENVSIKRGCVVFYRYCSKLQYILLFCNMLKNDFGLNINYKNIIRLYIFGVLCTDTA